MCQAFSALITKSGKVYWQAGLDSHDKLLEKFKSQDKELKDDKEPPNNTFARIEIIPHDKNYLNLKQKWDYIIDEKVKPDWLLPIHEKLGRQSLKKWQQEVYTFNLKEALNPIQPFKIKPPKITSKHLKLLNNWALVRALVKASVEDSVEDSVWASVRDSVRDSVWASVRDSVEDSVWASVEDSVRASVWAYNGSLFPDIKEWKYVDYNNKLFKKGKYPFQSAVDLWKMGLVPSYDGKLWRLHGGADAKILWEGKINVK